MQSAREDQLTSEEAESVKKLKAYEVADGETQGTTLSIVERALKKQRLKMKHPSSYIDTKFLLPTTNHVERLFSMSKRVFSSKRRSLLPRTLEALVFLKQNRSLWNLSMVSSVVKEAASGETVETSDSQSDDDSIDEF